LTDASTNEPLFEHSKRPEWGLAILAWEGKNKRRYQFQDGELREFKKGYYELLDQVDKPADKAEEIVRELKSMLVQSRLERDAAARPQAKTEQIGVDDQITIFKSLYPGGFQDAKWAEEVRGTDAERRLKKHLDPAIADARDRLSQERLDEALAAGNHGAVRDALIGLFNATDLVAAKHVRAFRDATEGEPADIAKTLRELLWGDGTYEERFRHWVGALRDHLGRRVTWEMATTPTALVHPDEHIPIKPTSFKRQAKSLAPTLRYHAVPRAELYERFRQMAMSVRRQLGSSGLEPRDMLDVYAFIWETLRPKSLKRLSAMAE